MGTIEIFKLFGSIFVDTDEADRSISKTGKEADGLGKKLTNGIKTAGKWALGVTTAAAGIGTAAFAMTNKVTQSFDQINKDSTKLGVLPETYQEMSYWADQNGISTSSMERAVGRLNQRIGLAADGNEKYAGALENLGVNMDEVRAGTLSTEDAMTQAIHALSQMENEQQKSAMAADLFGTKLARDLMPALQDGSMSFEEAAEEARKLGKVIGQDTLDAGTEFQDNMTRMNAMISGLTQNLLANLIPVFNSLLEWIIEHMPQIQAIIKQVFNVIGVVFDAGVIAVQWLIDAFGKLFSSADDNSNKIKEVIMTVFGWIKGFWDEWGEDIVEFFQNTFDSIYEVVQTIFDGIKKFWDRWGKTITKFFTTSFGVLKKLFEGTWNNFKIIIETTLNVIKGIIKLFFSVLTGDWEGAWDAIKGIAESVWNGIKDMFKNVGSTMSGIGKDIIRGLIKGIGSMAAAVKDKAKEIASGIGDSIKGFFGISSPSKLMIEYGGDIVDGLSDGISDTARKAIRTAQNVSATLSSAITRTPATAAAGGSSTVNHFNFTGPINVRDDNDVKLIARELDNLQRGRGRGEGI